MVKRKEFFHLQSEHFTSADTKRFFWQTQNPYVAQKEKELLSIIAQEKAKSILEVGCGEGANIVNLRNEGCSAHFTGLDLSYERVKFCHSLKLKGAHFLCASALNLPFLNNCFDLVFCRDLLHHVEDKKKVISEMVRVCKSGKKIVFIEGNGRKLTNFVFGMLFPAERGVKDSTPNKLRTLVKNFQHLNLEKFYTTEASNFFRLLLHYRLGFPALASKTFVRTFLNGLNRLAEKIISSHRYAYLITVATVNKDINSEKRL